MRRNETGCNRLEAKVSDAAALRKKWMQFVESPRYRALVAVASQKTHLARFTSFLNVVDQSVLDASSEGVLSERDRLDWTVSSEHIGNGKRLRLCW